MEIHHVGYLVADVKTAAKQFHSFGFDAVSEITYDPRRGMDFLFMENGEYRIELVTPKHEKAEMWKQLKKRGAMPYHICYRVDDLEKHIEKMGNNPRGGQNITPTYGGSCDCKQTRCIPVQ